MNTTSFDSIFSRFYDRLEKDQDFFDYYNIEMSEAIQIAHTRAKKYLIEALDRLCSVGSLQVDFSDYDDEIEEINFKVTSNEKRLIAEIMFEEYMKRDIPLLHAFKLSFSPSDLNVFSPANERKSYMSMIQYLETSVDEMIDEYKSRDRITGKLKKTIDYSKYEV